MRNQPRSGDSDAPVSPVSAPQPVAARIEASRPEPGLYLVATPIGAARDITLRALDVLNSADMLAAEDTRVLRHLLEIHGIPLRGRRILAYHDHNADRQRPAILAALARGESVAYTSDAGTPLVADPGYRLVQDALQAGARVHAVPGPSAMLAALSVSGLPSDRFAFVGFAPTAQGARRRWIAGWSQLDATVIAYESPRRVKQLLADLCDSEPNRDVVICRELTKKFEEVMRGTATDLLEHIPAEGLRGEVVLLFGRATPQTAGPDDIRAALLDALAGASVKDASAQVASRLNLPRKEVYAMALKMSRDDD